MCRCAMYGSREKYNEKKKKREIYNPNQGWVSVEWRDVIVTWLKNLKFRFALGYEIMKQLMSVKTF